MRAGRARARWSPQKVLYCFHRAAKRRRDNESAKGTLSIAYQINGESRLLSIEEAL